MASKIPAEWIHISVCIFALIVNSVVLLVIWKDPKKCLRTRPTMMINSLIISDLFAALINILKSRPVFDSAFRESKGYNVKNIKTLVNIAGYDAIIISFITIFLISVEHFLAITQPIKFKILVTKKLLTLIIVSTWTASTILTIVLFYLPGSNRLFQGITACTALLFIALPTIYAGAYFSLGKQSKTIKPEIDPVGKFSKQKIISQQRRFLITSAILVLAYLFTSAPFTIYNYFKISKNSSYNFRKDKDELGALLWTILHLNLCLDTFLYCLRIPQYRKSVAAFLRQDTT